MTFDKGKESEGQLNFHFQSWVKSFTRPPLISKSGKSPYREIFVGHKPLQLEYRRALTVDICRPILRWLDEFLYQAVISLKLSILCIDGASQHELDRLPNQGA